jgi:tRNA dimethylallyltransferase
MSSSDLSQNSSLSPYAKRHLPLVVIVGPTAVGKSDLAIQLAERLKGEIVSADSRLFYRGMDIGTAKPSIQDRLRVRHYLIDIAYPDETWSLALFQDQANRVIREILSHHHLPIMVGGTGQFIRSVTQGWNIPKVKPNPQLREALVSWERKIGPQNIHAKLAILDDAAAQAIDYHNSRRTIRALEVIFTTGHRFSDQKQAGRMLYQTLMIGLNRPRVELYQRIDKRVEDMIASGLIDEVRELLASGYSSELPTMSAIGYGEIVAYINGELTLDEAKMLVKRRTRKFVRRQANWFKSDDPDIHWFDVDHDSLEKIESFIYNWLITEKITLY